MRSKSSESTFMKFDDPNLEYKIVDRKLYLRSATQISGYLNASMKVLIMTVGLILVI